MSATVAPHLPESRHRLSISLDRWNMMLETGVVGEKEPLCLIEGEIVEMTPPGPEHSATTSQTNLCLSRQIDQPSEAIIREEKPINLGSFSQPQPDVVILKPEPSGYYRRFPTEADVLLCIEVALSSLIVDRREMIPLYARHGIPESWIVNIAEGLVEVYRNPRNGQYTSLEKVGRGGFVSPEALPNVRVAVDDILGTPTTP